ncbi:helix-turn-helix transcriptional regulator [Pseudomonas paraeruginosa]|uniref:AlpA family phage regulatory protein n=1 Tax=Pseudomonas aeruginosa TaxID=287 RepID=A0ABD7K1Z3_PSEAI|nr:MULTISPECIES: AlpA family phage regulatory protein [Pseudomonas aeruginosa group]KFF31910.1 prophage CP4-57 regulator [Pseudomonas aeruginosa VRFPA01]MBG7302621.1 AlpA family phage regulatory protein [Pseudomonas aeruginosa]RTR95936.1 AlpA family phage regulatory protein [Pseudomonas paraeruginosa]RTS44239.1 AlpA family phage regulatory protein [Pseudomonas aeruginosa]HBP6436167.1 transcriptional regulator [Pseudomonas aeruginosa]
MAQHTAPEVEELRFLRLPEVEKATGKKRSTIYRDIASGRFPAPYDLGSSRSVGWLSTEISAWILSRPRVQLRGGHNND